MPKASEEYELIETLQAEARQLVADIQHANDDTETQAKAVRLTEVVDEISAHQEVAQALIEGERNKLADVQKHHRAVAQIPEEVIYHMMQVPDDVMVTAVDYDPMTQLWNVYMAGERFPETEVGTHAYAVQAMYEVVEDRQIIRFDFPMYPPKEEGSEDGA